MRCISVTSEIRVRSERLPGDRALGSAKHEFHQNDQCIDSNKGHCIKRKNITVRMYWYKSLFAHFNDPSYSIVIVDK